MKNLIRIILVTCMMSLMSCSKDTHIISHDEMANIYAEMLMRDQWLNSNFDQRSRADTTFVYGSILEKYGYSRDEFNEAVSFYVDHPQFLTKILTKTESLLDGRRIVVENLIKQKEEFIADSLAAVKKAEKLEALIASVPKPEWEFSDSLEIIPVPDSIFPAVYPKEEIERQTEEIKAARRREMSHRRDSLSRNLLDSFLKSMADSLELHCPDSLDKVFSDPMELSLLDSLEMDACDSLKRELLDSLRKSFSDSLALRPEKDIAEKELPDTLWFGPLRSGYRPSPDWKPVVSRTDSLSVKDSLAVKDTLAVVDESVEVDTVTVREKNNKSEICQ